MKRVLSGRVHVHTQHFPYLHAMRATLVVRTIVMAVPWLGIAVLTRPRASDWPEAVARMRRKDKLGAGTFDIASKPIREVWDTPERWRKLSAMVRERFYFGVERWPEDRLWALDAGLVSLGCTSKKCFVGVLGSWNGLPGPQYDLYALAAAHGVACFVYHSYGPGTFYRYFAPLLSKPHTVLCGAFATSSAFEMLWLGSSLLGLGHELQRALGRAGFLALWLCGALGMSLAAATQRHSTNGTGGILAAFTYHTLAMPHARHSLYGVSMSARSALAVHLGIACLPAFQGSDKPAVALGLAALPLAVGAAFFHGGWLRLRS